MNKIPRTLFNKNPRIEKENMRRTNIKKTRIQKENMRLINYSQPVDD